MAVKAHTQQIAKAAGAKAFAGKRNERIRLNDKTIGVLWTRGSGAIALYVDKAVKVNGKLKKQTDVTSEGVRLRLTKEQVEAGELGAAEELVKLAAATVAKSD
jgi:hypothetical protein